MAHLQLEMRGTEKLVHNASTTGDEGTGAVNNACTTGDEGIVAEP